MRVSNPPYVHYVRWVYIRVLSCLCARVLYTAGSTVSYIRIPFSRASCPSLAIVVTNCVDSAYPTTNMAPSSLPCHAREFINVNSKRLRPPDGPIPPLCCPDFPIRNANAWTPRRAFNAETKENVEKKKKKRWLTTQVSVSEEAEISKETPRIICVRALES